MKGIKKELMILGVIIVLLMAYLAFKSDDQVHYDVPELEALKVENLDKIEIKKPDGAITLEQKEKKWQIAPNGYPTAEDKIKNITKTVTELSLTDLVSKAKNYERYHLHKDKVIHVLVYEKDKVVRDFEIGKVSPTYGHTYVKIKDDDKVYHARESFRNYFDTKVDDLRDKKVMKVDKNEITEMEMAKDGLVYAFARKVKSLEAPPPPEADKTGDKPKTITPPTKPEEEISWLMPDGKKGNTGNIDSLIGQLTDLSCDSYIDGKTKEDYKLQVAVYSLKLKGSKDFSLTIYRKLEEGDNKGKYPAVSSENAYPFYLSSWKAEQITKKPEDLIEKPAAPKEENK
jgi:hypothetical protein